MNPSTTHSDFPIDAVLDRIREAVAPFPPAVMFELADLGYSTLFQQIVACVVSIRTREEVTRPICLRLFAEASGPETFIAMSDVEIGRLIRPSTFHEQKARQIREIARIAADREGTDLECSRDEVLALPGVGPKCANLALGIACGLPLIAVDIHVHRVVNRWGYVRANSPERTMDALSGVLPERRRVEINRLLVPFGKNICTGILPKCSTCPVRLECRQVGVTGCR